MIVIQGMKADLKAFFSISTWKLSRKWTNSNKTANAHWNDFDTSCLSEVNVKLKAVRRLVGSFTNLMFMNGMQGVHNGVS